MELTYEEFREAVKERLTEYLADISEEEIDEYLADEDSVDVITQEYNLSIKQLERGEITDNEFRNGSVSAAANSLYLLY